MAKELRQDQANKLRESTDLVKQAFQTVREDTVHDWLYTVDRII